MRRLIHEHGNVKGSRVVDVGSRDQYVGNNYRKSVMELGAHEYTGIDSREGNNVDVVVPQVGDWRRLVKPADLVISGQCLESIHIRSIAGEFYQMA